VTFPCLVSGAEARAEAREAESRRAHDGAHRYLRNLFLSSVLSGQGGEKLPDYGGGTKTVREAINDSLDDEARIKLLDACQSALRGDAHGAQRALVAYINRLAVEWADDRVEGAL
jgi:hypothetical protein